MLCSLEADLTFQVFAKNGVHLTNHIFIYHHMGNRDFARA